ncbi:MAG TPA: DUF92 domain-containing protein [Methanomassiliicoccales archaeon]|jgi:uncharacterized protein (TIGR00297 family)|nr:DUF92 domain-containing protein [Methanomassiliicoccales archaeon]HQM67629.1 DUF92 domain-containing protein [Methanomassiliicoccales archaeon]
MIALEQAAAVLVLCAALSALSWKLGLLTADGSLASFAVGMVLGVFGGVGWLFLLILFAFMGFLVTKYKMELKVRKGVQEGRKGERGYRNVLANGAVPMVIALLTYAAGWEGHASAVVYISAVCVAAADTTASELGVLSDRTYLITTFKRVRPGVDGGVSLYGTAWAVAASAFAAVVGWFVIIGTEPTMLVLVPVGMGVAGCFIDSVIGATLETKGWVTKLGNNIVSMALGALLSLPFLP